MKLIITRHGETIENKKGIIQGHLHGTLSELGKEQVRKVAERLKDEKIDYIYSSDLARASDTAKKIAKFHPKTPLHLVKELRERYWGTFQGKTKKELELDKKEIMVKFIHSEKGVESIEELYQRAKKFLDKIIHKHHNDNILFVGHTGINKALICVITNKKAKGIPNIEYLHKTGINIYEIDEDRNHKIHLFNCNKHLA